MRRLVLLVAWLCLLVIGDGSEHAPANGLRSASTVTATPATVYDASSHNRRRPFLTQLHDTAVRLPGGSLLVAGANQIWASPAVSVAAETADVGASTDAAESCLNSFTGDTPVLLADGSKKPIDQVKVGDKVIATDPETGVTDAESVVELIHHSGRHAMVAVTLVDGSVLDSTDGHPTWDATRQAFVEASQLRVGDKIETNTVQPITISALTDYTTDLTAYNLQIDQIHTYYAGTTPVLVHNSCGPLTTAQATQMADRVGYRATNQTVRGQRVFTNGKNYIVQDIDSHSGGLWEMADTIRGLGSKTTRTGTFDYNLDYVGP